MSDDTIAETDGREESDEVPVDSTDPGIPGESLLEANALTRRFGAVTVLEDVTVSFPSGSVVAVIGPNGSGKTTLLRLLVGDLAPTSGTVEYLGPETDRPIGYLPQRPTFRPGFTALETLEFYCSLVDGPAPSTLLDRVGLLAAADRRVEALSGGMQRLLGIAQATVGDPPVIVLDEPASGLDPNMRRHVFDSATKMAARGKTVVLSSHDLSLVEESADVAVLLSEGRVLASGSPKTLCKRFETERLRGVLEAIAADDGRVSVVGGRS